MADTQGFCKWSLRGFLWQTFCCETFNSVYFVELKLKSSVKLKSKIDEKLKSWIANWKSLF